MIPAFCFLYEHTYPPSLFILVFFSSVCSFMGIRIDQMAELFQRDKSTISRHIKNIFTEGELQRDSVVAKFATTASDRKVYNLISLPF